MKYAMMKECQGDDPVPFMCRVYEVSPSGYTAWLGRSPSKRAQKEGRLEVEIRAAHPRTRETDGPEGVKVKAKWDPENLFRANRNIKPI